MRLVGAALVVLSCSILGLARAEMGRRRLRLLRALAAALHALEGELCDSLRPVRETLELLAASGDEAAPFFRHCLEDYGERPLRVLWAELSERLDGLTAEERQTLARVGTAVGRRETERQREELSRAAAYFAAAAASAGETAGKEYRLRAALGLGSGVLLAVLAI